MKYSYIVVSLYYSRNKLFFGFLDILMLINFMMYAIIILSSYIQGLWNQLNRLLILKGY